MLFQSQVSVWVRFLLVWYSILTVKGLTMSRHDHSFARTRNSQLNDEMMMELMQIKGVPYIPDYMAPNEEVARKQFPNMIQLTENYKDAHHKPHKFDSKTDNDMTKQRLLHDIKVMENHVSHTATGHPQQQPKTGQALLDNLHRLTEELLHLNFTTHSRLLSLLLPETGPNLLLRRKRQISDISGAVTNTAYCKEKGTLTSDGAYLRMCSTCSATTTLPEGHFPRVINEVVCSNTDRGCLTVQGVDHGRCTQKVFHLNMLRRTNDTSVPLTSLGDTDLSSQWEVYTQKIRVSCECEIDKLSMFAAYIPCSSASTST